MSTNGIDISLLEDFVVESGELLTQAESDLLALDLDESPVDPALINRIFRAVHSVKGAAGFFGFSVIGDLSHVMENLLMQLREGELTPSTEMIDTLLKTNDRLKLLVASCTTSNEEKIDAELTMLNVFLAPLKGAAAHHSLLPSTKAVQPETDQPGRDAQTSVAKPKLSPPESQQDRVQEYQLSIEKRAELGRNGFRLYRLEISGGDHLDQQGLTIYEFLKAVNSVGEVLHCSVDPETVVQMTDEQRAELSIQVHASTVLEPALAAVGFGIPADCIHDIPLKPKALVTQDRSPSPEGPSMGPTNQSKQRLLQPQRRLPQKAPSADSSQSAADAERGVFPLQETVRVKTSVLNALMETAGEMVLARNRLMRCLTHHADGIEGLSPILQQMSTITSEVQEQIMRTRLQPIGSLFGRFNRLMRDLSSKLQKKIKFKTRGGDVELDRTIIEGLADPLNHLLRNSCDHGIESPSEREAANKDQEGTVSITAYHEAGMVNIDVEDDGGGIDVEFIKEKALYRGLMSLEQLDQLSDHEALNLIQMPGLSTAEEITDLSGRGVGMDVVRTNIENLGGTVEITSQKGLGSKITLKLPLTLAIVSSLIVETQGQCFALPQVGLEEAIRIKPGGNDVIERVRGADVLRHRGKLLPIVRLADVLELKQAYIDPETGTSRPERRRNLSDQRFSGPAVFGDQPEGRMEERRRPLSNVQRILVLRVGRNRFGLMVDYIVDNEEIVVKPLSSFVRGCPCFSGVTILGDGTISMILDPVGIVQQAGLKFDELEREEQITGRTEQELSMREPLSIVLLSNDTEETFAVPLSQISRIEKIRTADIDRIGDEEFLQYRGAPLPLVRIHRYLPVQHPATEPATMNVLIPKLYHRRVGLVTARVIDAIETEVNLDRQTIAGDGLFGSAVVNGKIVLLLNIHELALAAYPIDDPASGQLSKISKQLRVLLAEDTPVYQAILTSYLEKAGTSVSVAANGEEAWRMLQADPYDVLITDLMMPQLDGSGLVSRIRTSDKLSDLPILEVISGGVSDSALERKISGVNASVSKLDGPGLLGSIVRLTEETGAMA